MSLIDFFTPVNRAEILGDRSVLNSQFGSFIDSYETEFPALEGVDIAIFGVMDDRGAVNNQGCATAGDSFRREFYQLHQGDYAARIADLGNILQGYSINDTYSALKTVVGELVKGGVLPVIIGGGQDLTYGQYLAYEDMEKLVSMLNIDAMLDLEPSDEQGMSKNHVNKILIDGGRSNRQGDQFAVIPE